MFQFRRFPSYTYEFSIRYMMINHVDCSIRKSADQSVLTTPRGLSQLTTSFFGSWCQGIHPALFLTLPIFKWVSVLFKNCSFPTRKISLSRISLVALLVVSYLHFSILFSSCSVLFQEQVSAKVLLLLISILEMVGTSGLEPPTSRLSGVRSNHLSYAPVWWRWGGSNSWPPACKAGALPAELHPHEFVGTQVFLCFCLDTKNQYLQNWTISST